MALCCHLVKYVVELLWIKPDVNEVLKVLWVIQEPYAALRKVRYLTRRTDI